MIIWYACRVLIFETHLQDLHFLQLGGFLRLRIIVLYFLNKTSNFICIFRKIYF